MLKKLFSFVLAAIAFSTFAQKTEIRPAFYDQFFYRYELLNVAAMQPDSSFQIKSGYRAGRGILKDIGETNIHIAFRLKRNSANLFDRVNVGVSVLNEFETRYLNRLRLYGHINSYAPLNSTTSLAGGISAGFFNYAVKGTNSSAGASAFSFDANAGLWLFNPGYKVGISLNQFPNSKSRLLESELVLKNFWSIQAEKKLELNPYLKIIAAGMINFPDVYQGYSATARMVYNDRFSAGTGGDFKNFLIFFFGLEQFNFLKLDMQLGMSYRLSISRFIPFNNEKLELYFRLTPGKQG